MNFIVAVMDGIDMTEVIRTDNTDVIANACKKIAELEKQIEQLTYLHNEDVNTIKLLNKQIKEIKEK